MKIFFDSSAREGRGAFLHDDVNEIPWATPPVIKPGEVIPADPEVEGSQETRTPDTEESPGVLPSHIVQIALDEWNAAMAGQAKGKEIWAGADGKPELRDVQYPREQWEATMRVNRDKLLAACDWTQVSDAPITAEKKAAWAKYRTALRDIPQTTSDPSKVQWPTPPE